MEPTIPRRSLRTTQGKPPVRYGQPESASRRSSVSSTTIRRKRLEAELEHQRRQAQITNQLAEQERRVATAEFQLRQAELDEEEDERLLALGDQFSGPNDNKRISPIKYDHGHTSPLQRQLQLGHYRNQLETETAHTHSEVADADADSPTAESTAATSTAAHGSGPDFAAQPKPVSSTQHSLLTCTSIATIGNSAPALIPMIPISNTSSPTLPDVTPMMNQTSTTSTTSLASTQSSSTPTTSQHQPHRAQPIASLTPTSTTPSEAAQVSSPFHNSRPTRGSSTSSQLTAQSTNGLPAQKSTTMNNNNNSNVSYSYASSLSLVQPPDLEVTVQRSIFDTKD